MKKISSASALVLALLLMTCDTTVDHHLRGDSTAITNGKPNKAYDTKQSDGEDCEGLPVLCMLSFSCTNVSGDYQLEWWTLYEVNCYGFDVQRKVGGDDWVDLGFVPGNGTTNQPQYYSFTDDNNPHCLVSYRLKVIGLDATLVYISEINGQSQSQTCPIAALKWFQGSYIPSTDDNVLTWETASETNCERFYIQRKIGDGYWTVIGNVAGHGTTTQTNNYSFTDVSPYCPTASSYRLLIEPNNETAPTYSISITRNPGGCPPPP